jgi:hypothetical protein
LPTNYWNKTLIVTIQGEQKPITKKHQYITYIECFSKEHGYQPTLEQIAQRFNRGISTIYMTLQKAGIKYAHYREFTKTKKGGILR